MKSQATAQATVAHGGGRPSHGNGWRGSVALPVEEAEAVATTLRRARPLLWKRERKRLSKSRAMAAMVALFFAAAARITPADVETLSPELHAEALAVLRAAQDPSSERAFSALSLVEAPRQRPLPLPAQTPAFARPLATPSSLLPRTEADTEPPAPEPLEAPRKGQTSTKEGEQPLLPGMPSQAPLPRPEQLPVKGRVEQLGTNEEVPPKEPTSSGASWRELRERLRARVGEKTFSIWLEGLRPQAGSPPGTLTLLVPNEFYWRNLEENFRALLEEEARAVAGHPVRVLLKVAKPSSSSPPPPPKPEAAPRPKSQAEEANEDLEARLEAVRARYGGVSFKMQDFILSQWRTEWNAKGLSFRETPRGPHLLG